MCEKLLLWKKAKAQTEEEAISDPVKSKIFYKYMDANQVGMVGHFDAKGDYIKGIEDIFRMFNTQQTNILQ